ncbi:MAG: hypothetical protein P4K94_11835 [Terracidiphilus sp.]|nr:hypothetical protein [Terracidiphilus sp.]
MAFNLLSIAVVSAAAFYMVRWRAGLRRRNAQSWDSLVQRLQPDWNAPALNYRFSGNAGQNATPEEMWGSVQGAHGLWAMYENARVMLEIADYAARNSASVDRELIAALRSDAMQVRVCVLRALVQYAFSQVNESICVNAYRAASMYSDMAAHMRQLIEVNAGGMIPASVAAM